MTPIPALSVHPTAANIEQSHDQRVNALAGMALDYKGWHQIVAADVMAKWQAHDTVEELVQTIMKYLLTPFQIQWLCEHQMSLVELLRGQFPDSDLDEVEALFCDEWNRDIGTNVFGYPNRRGGRS